MFDDVFEYFKLNGNAVTLVISFISLYVYKWVACNYIAQPRWNHPPLLHNHKIAIMAVSLPWVGLVASIASGFLFTSHGFLWLIGIFILFVIFSRPKHKDHDPLGF